MGEQYYRDGMYRANNRANKLQAEAVQLREQLAEAQAIVTKTSELLGLIYPPESFDGSSGDRGSVLVAEIRAMIETRKDGE